MGFGNLVKRNVQSQLALSGRTVAPIGTAASPCNVLRVHHARGLQPKSVFDIGVAYGTPWLSDAFPGAKFDLIDPARKPPPHV